jgi:hypothetical protein
MATTGNGCLLALSALTVEVFRFELIGRVSAIEVSVPMALDWSGEVFFGRDFFLSGLRADFMVDTSSDYAKDSTKYFATGQSFIESVNPVIYFLNCAMMAALKALNFDP